METYRDEHGRWWQVDIHADELLVPILDAELVAELEYLHGACPYCGMRHDEEDDCE